MTATQPQSVDIAIVGGGMAGASFALMLAHYCPALSVALLERRALPEPGASVVLPSFDTRATALSAGSLQMLEQMGVWSALQQFASPISRVAVSDRGHSLGVSLNAEEQPRANFDGMLGAVIENAALGPVLYQALMQTAVTVLAPAAVTRVDIAPGEVSLQLACAEKSSEPVPDSLRARLLVIADGADSSLCQTLGIHTDKIEYDQHALVTTIGLQRDHGGVAYERFTPDGPMALLPLPPRDGQHRMALVWTCPSADAPHLQSLPEAEFLQRLQKTFGWRAGRFERCAAVQSYPLSLSLAREQWRRDLVLLGNAAHFLHPVAGQGFNLTLRDCYGLARLIEQRGLPDSAAERLALMQAYGEQRENDQLLTVEFSNRVPALFSSAAVPLQGARQLGLLGLALSPALRSGFAGQAAGFGL